jgi:hypothetical protein
MKISFTLKIKNPFYYLYLVLILANLVFLFFLYNFLDKYIYSAIVTNHEFIVSQALKHESDINVKKFEEIINKIEVKTNHNRSLNHTIIPVATSTIEK